MKTYTATVLFSIFFIVSCNCLFNLGEASVLYFLLGTIIAVLFVVAVDGLFAILVHDFPRLFIKDYATKTKYYNAEHFPFKTYKWERGFYESIRIRAWKDLLPAKMGMDKTQIEHKDDVAYLDMFLIESCRAETMHLLSSVFGFSVILLFPIKYLFMISLPVAIVNFIMQILPVMVQRYTRPKLLVLRKRQMLKRVMEQKTQDQMQA